MTTFPSAPNHKASVSSENQPSSLDDKTQLTDFSQISAHASGAWRHSHPPGHISIWDFCFDITKWHILPPHAGTHLRSCLHLINPCTKRKVLSITKPKGKIYKTKSLSHYITHSLIISAKKMSLKKVYLSYKTFEITDLCKKRGLFDLESPGRIELCLLVWSSRQAR